MKMKVDIKGTVISNDSKWIYDLLELQSVCPKDVLCAIEKANGNQLDVYINSDGGDVFAGTEIYAALREYVGQVKIHIVGRAASIASVIACAGHSDISPTGMLMIHNVSSVAQGDYHVMDKSSEVLQQAGKAICAAYVEKTGMPEEELLKDMDTEKWLTAKEAVERGFINQIAENRNLQLTASICNVIPNTVINHLKGILKNESIIPPNKAGVFMQETAQAKLNLLKLRGVK